MIYEQIYRTTTLFMYTGRRSGNIKSVATGHTYLRTIPIRIKYTNLWLLDIAKFFGNEEATKRFIGKETKLLDIGGGDRNPSLNCNLGENTKFPYFPNWYEKDTFAYIDEGNG